ncbi:unnamed protein product [Angiostrongylus costaricensis]|uniref:Uncharacterized protein n=1 Tax=Angiostrongylus costaricensis TaxID=334426 RepID=A0A0R3PVA8_ANGCS|nr:unnamed protein product [Angiostrongylus costaricensis]
MFLQETHLSIPSRYGGRATGRCSSNFRAIDTPSLQKR